MSVDVKTDEAALKAGSVGLGGAVVQAAAQMAPGVSIAATLVFLAPLAGVGSPSAMLIGALIALCLGLVIAEFARKLPTAGSFYNFVTAGIGLRSGFAGGVLLFAAYLGLLPFQAAYFATFTSSYLATLDIHIGWVVWAVALLVLSTSLALLGITRSLKVGLLALAFEVGVFSVLTVAILIQGGADGLSAVPFDPTKAPGGLHGAILATVYGIFAFVGFESATTLGEEAREPKRIIPRAVVGTVLALGAFEVLATYAGVIGFGTDAAALTAMSGTAIPFNDLAQHFVGSGMSTLVTISVMSSLIGVNVVTVSAGARILFALGRDGLLPAAFGRTNRRHAPAFAILCIGGVALTVTLIPGAIWGPENIAAWAGFLITLYFIGAYAILTVSLPLFYRRHHADEWSYFKHALMPLITLVALGVVTYGNVYPLPPSPLRYFIWVTLATAAIAVVIAAVLQSRRPDALRDAGKIFGGMAEDAIAAHPEERAVSAAP